ncbi:MAG: periplasmic heavy metal sensor [Geminicoccaceae bacterium]
MLVVAIGVGAGVVAATGSGWHGGGMRDFAERRLTRALDAVDATPEQKEQIQAIAEAAHDDLAPLLEELRGARGELAGLLAEPVIDTAAVEQLRTSRMAALDTVGAVPGGAPGGGRGARPDAARGAGGAVEEHRGWRGHGRD